MYNIIRSAVITVKDGITTAIIIVRITDHTTVHITDLTTGLIISRSSAIIALLRHAITVRLRFTAQDGTAISTGVITATALTAHRTIHSSRIMARADSATHLILKA